MRILFSCNIYFFNKNRLCYPTQLFDGIHVLYDHQHFFKYKSFGRQITLAM